MTLNLLTQPGGMCANCATRLGPCQRCGTYWHGGTGYRLVWPDNGPDAFVRAFAEVAAKLDLPPDILTVL